MPWHMCGTCESWFSTSSVYIVGMDFGLSGFLVSTSTHPLSHVSGMCMHACLYIYNLGSGDGTQALMLVW